MPASQQTQILAGPPCEKCGGPTRILRIDSHPRLKRRHVWTLECMKCGAEHVLDMPVPRHTH